MYEVYEALLLELGLTSSRVSAGTGIANSTLSDWKHGIITLKYEKVVKIAKFLNTTPEFIMTGNYKYRYIDKPITSVMMLNKERQELFEKLPESKQLMFKEIINQLFDSIVKYEKE